MCFDHIAKYLTVVKNAKKFLPFRQTDLFRKDPLNCKASHIQSSLSCQSQDNEIGTQTYKSVIRTLQQ